jgi:hypothetical protein
MKCCGGMVLVATPTLQFGGIAGNYAASGSPAPSLATAWLLPTSTACGKLE